MDEIITIRLEYDYTPICVATEILEDIKKLIPELEWNWLEGGDGFEELTVIIKK